MAIMEWFKVNGYNLIYGSLRLDPPIHQLVFIKMLALTSISRVSGVICIAEKVPYPMDVLATTLGISEKELVEAIEYNCHPDRKRLKKNDWGGIEVVNWPQYQSKSYLRVRKHREKKKREEKRIEENRREEKQCSVTVTSCNDIVTKNDRNDKSIKEKKHSTRSKKTFKPPTLQEVQAYIKENNYDVDAEKFIKYYAEANWHDQSGKPVKSWKQKLIAVWATKKRKTVDGENRRSSYAEQESAYGTTV